MRPTGSRARAPPWSAVKQTTSQRPTPGLAPERGRARHRAGVGGQRREAVLEHDHVVVGRRDLGRPAVPRRAERALVGRGQVGPALAVGGDDHPLLQQRVAADLAGGDGRGQVAGVGGPPVDPLALVEVEQLAPVGQPDRGLDQLHHAAQHTGAPAVAGGIGQRGGKIPPSRSFLEEAPCPVSGVGRLLAVLALAGALLAGCSGGEAPRGTVNVPMYDNFFAREVTRVPAGATVRFPNQGRTPHNAVAVDGAWRTPDADRGRRGGHGRARPAGGVPLLLHLPRHRRTAARAWPPPWSWATSATTRARRRPGRSWSRWSGPAGSPAGSPRTTGPSRPRSRRPGRATWC